MKDQLLIVSPHYTHIDKLFQEEYMKRLFFVFSLMALGLTSVAAQQAAVEVSFEFTRQGGRATNQFAIWIEDAQGQVIKTLSVTRWTARGGWNRRPDSIPVWVRQSNVSSMSRGQIDTISSATPRTGLLTFSWDGTNNRGMPVPDGEYMLTLEGTLRWENRVIYSVPIVLGQGANIAEVNVEYFGESTTERSMINNVRVRVLR
jgi:hypothetical protein